jgi:two-component system, sensor histidine kinase and response regulator
MTLALETQVLYEVALSIGEHADLTPMLRHTVSELLRLTNSNGAFVVRFGEGAAVGDPGAAPEVACLLPRNLERHDSHTAFVRQWEYRALYRTLHERSVDRPMSIALDDATAHAFLLAGFGLLVVYRKQGALPESFLRAFAPLARKLANSARACVLEEELRRQSWRLELATSSAQIGVWQFDLLTGRLVWDKVTFELFGTTPDRFGGTMEDFLRRLRPDERPRIETHLAGHAQGPPVHGDTFELEFAVITDEGTERQLYASGRVQRDREGLPVTIVGINIDITARKETEAALRRARDLAEATNQAKSHFIANMSHELRTPLNGIIGMTDLALGSELTNTQREYLRVVRSSADSLLVILNDILDFSKIDAGEMQVESIPFSLPAALAEALKSLAARAQQKQLELVLDLPDDLPVVSVGDPGRIRQILLNLCDNALKFTTSGQIVVSVRTEPLSGSNADLITISVRDTGIGIPAEKLEQVFDAFQQGDASITRRFGGTGLGLSISRRLAQLMGGRLSATSAVGKGSTFTLAVPMPRSDIDSLNTEDEPPGTRHLPTVHPRPRRVLVVEDNPVNQQVATGMLEKLGYDVVVATNGAEALLHTDGEAFDLIFMDMQMPVLDGLAATREIRRRDGPSRRAPIVAMTANAMAEEKEQCLAVGMDDHLAKPVRLSTLQDVLQRYAPR